MRQEEASLLIRVYMKTNKEVRKAACLCALYPWMSFKQAAHQPASFLVLISAALIELMRYANSSAYYFWWALRWCPCALQVLEGSKELLGFALGHLYVKVGCPRRRWNSTKQTKPPPLTSITLNTEPDGTLRPPPPPGWWLTTFPGLQRSFPAHAPCRVPAWISSLVVAKMREQLRTDSQWSRSPLRALRRRAVGAFPRKWCNWSVL